MRNLLCQNCFTPSLNFHDTMKITDRKAHCNNKVTPTPSVKARRHGLSLLKCRLHICDVYPTVLHTTVLKGSSLGKHLGECLSKTKILSLAQCLCSGIELAIHSPHPGRPPLTHDNLCAFVSNFVLPYAADQCPLRQNHRLIVVLPPDLVALLVLGNYDSYPLVNLSCTSIKLEDDTLRLLAEAIITSKDVRK